MAEFPAIKACIFDVDGLLINSEDIYSQTINNVLHKYGLPDIPWNVKATQQSRSNQGWVNVMKWAKLPVSVDDFKAEVAVQRESFRQCKLLPGVPELLHNLDRRVSAPLQLAIASITTIDFFKLKTETCQDILSVIPEKNRVFHDDPAMSDCKGKPAPDIYKLALKRVNDSLAAGVAQIKPEECLVFEDSTAEVEAGQKAGMRVAWVPHPGLLQVYKGKEDMVLDGLLDEYGEMPNKPGAKVERFERNELPVSTDGRTVLVTDLKEFPYEFFGIQLRSQDQH